MKTRKIVPRHESTMPLKFETEYLLQQAIAGLLSKMPNVSGVQILQGAQEYGKDIVFYVPGGLADKLLCACVVKNTKITGQVSASSGARTVMLQAQQALDTPHVAATGSDEWVQHVYIITPYPIDPSAVSAIQGALKEKRGQVEFIGGPALFDLFRKYWPDFVADEADAISRYIAVAKDTFEQNHPISEVASMYQLGTVEKGTAWIHVPQSFERTIATYGSGDGVERLVPNLGVEWKKRDLKTAATALHRLGGVMRIIAEWGLWDLQKANRFDETVVAVCREMEAAWREAMHRQYKVALDKVDRVGPDAAVVLANRSSLEESLEESLAQLRATANLALVDGVDRVCKDAASLISAKPARSSLFNDHRFLPACVITDFASVLPPGFLEEEAKYTWRFELADLQNNYSLLVVGSAGYGKTSFCRWSFLNDAERLKAGTSDRVPIYVALHKAGSAPLNAFQDLFRCAVGRSGLVAGVDSEDATKTRIYLDGLDEVAEDKARRQIVLLARQKIESDPDTQIVITSRSYVQGPWLSWLPRLSLSGFTETQIDRLVSEWFDGRAEEVSRFKTQLKATPALGELMRVPLIATLVILVFRQTRRLPESRARVYDVFVDLMCEGWNLAKRLLRTSRFGLRVKKAVLGKVAITAHRRKSRGFSERDIHDAVEACVAKAVCEDWTELKEELFQDGLISRSGVHCEFAHLSFQEFLAAKELLGEPTHLQLKRALADYLRGDDWWLEALRFYVGLSASPRETYDWIIKQADKLSESDTEECAGGDPNDRAEALLESVIENFPEAPMAF